jgi:hypothetical protein
MNVLKKIFFNDFFKLIFAYAIFLFIITAIVSVFAFFSSPSFHTYDEAIKYVENDSSFIKDVADTSKSSWVNGAFYYRHWWSYRGYAVFVLNDKKYIHAKMPFWAWNKFKKAESFGTFYDNNIRNKYQLKLEETSYNPNLDIEYDDCTYGWPAC